MKTPSIIGLMLLGVNPLVSGEVRTIFVDAAANGASDGSTWTDAHTDLQTAMDSAEPGDVIWVAAGSYHPGTTRSSSFVLHDGVAIYGGLAGDEDPLSFNLSSRDILANETILDGLLPDGERTYHVLSATGVDEKTVVDGFTITRGSADGVTQNQQDVGGGALIVDASPVFRRCRFVENEAGTRGGAVHVDRGSPTFVHCAFFLNRSTVTQGENNYGGAFFATGSTLTFARPTLLNCLFVGNTAGVGNGGSGGAIYVTPSTLLTVINCTIAHNFADTDAGGVFGSPTVVGSTIWGNIDRRGRSPSSQMTGSAVVSYSCVEGGWNGVGNTAEDPRFVDPMGPDQSPGTVDDDLRLLPGSPCIDAGNNESLIASLSTDLDGAPRFADDPVTDDRGLAGEFGAVVDMGAFEYQAECNTDQDCNDGFVCNGVESCDAGKCTAGVRVDCRDGLECTVDSCNENDGTCVHTPVDTLCDNGLFCDGVETCDAIRGCLAGSAVLCVDGFDCTDDRCDEDLAGCVFEPIDALCDNGDACDGRERCVVGRGCVATGAVECDDGVACTIDSCDPATGACLFELVDSFCDDGLFCNGSETCGTGGCLPAEAPCGKGTFCDETLDQCVTCLTAEHCDDANPCTIDTCDSGTCTHETVADCCQSAEDCTTHGPCVIPLCEQNRCGEQPSADGASCSDGLFCNGEERCVSGVCLPGSPPCTGIEVCSETSRSCQMPPQCATDADCDDANACTDETCDHGSCISSFNSAPCDDDDGCTSNDVCSAGTCAGVAIPGCGDSIPPPPPPPPSTDTDGDGVADIDDQCPSTPAGIAVDQNGCPLDPPPGQTVVDEDGNRDSNLTPDGHRTGGRNPDFVSKSDRPAANSTGDNEQAGQSVPTDDPTLDDTLNGIVDQTNANRASCGACGVMGMVSAFLLCFGLGAMRFVRSRDHAEGQPSANHAKSV